MNGNFRWGDVGVIAAIICNIVVGTWEIAHLDGRIGALEKDQLRDELSLGNLENANANKDIHFTKVDSAIDQIKNDVGSILDIVQKFQKPILGEDANNPPNFYRRK